MSDNVSIIVMFEGFPTGLTKINTTLAQHFEYPLNKLESRGSVKCVLTRYNCKRTGILEAIKTGKRTEEWLGQPFGER